MSAADRSAKSSASWLDLARVQLARSVDGASLATFRICFGLVMVWHMLKYFQVNGGITEIERVFASPSLHFTYPWFHWVQPWPQPWLTVHFAVVSVAALLVALGLFYRTACVTLFLGYTYIFLLEAALYNNHYYLISLLSFVLIFMPATRCWSLDNLLRRKFSKQPSPPTAQPGAIPFWPIFLLRFQLFLVYFYGGIAKLNGDWLTGEPLYAPGNMLYDFFDSSIGLPESLKPIHLCLFLAWGGLFYDLSIGFLLLWGRTRWLALAATALFHLHNHFIFPIGIFPAMALSSTLIFFAPDWPRQLWSWVCRPHWNFTAHASTEAARPANSAPRLTMGVTIALAAFVLWQATWPLRHFVIEGDANWTEEGQDFAWRMMLRAKAAGHLTCRVVDPAIHTVNAKGRPVIQWEACPDGTPKAIHIAIDSHQFNWSHHPGLTITHEPIVGHRLIYNPSNIHTDRQEAIDAGRFKIQEQWNKTFNRSPKIEPTISLAEAVRMIRERFQQRADQLKLSAEARDEFLRQLTAMEQEDESHQQPAAGSEPRRVQLVNSLQRLYQSPLADIVRPVIRRIEPFVLQGAPTSSQPLLVIVDPALSASSDAEADLLELSAGEPYIVWTDFSRMRPDDYRRLPQHFVTFDDRQLHMVWNHFREIEPYQLEKAAVRPWMIHQYAQKVGQRWQAETGRRGEVHVESYVMMNYTVPQMLLDPEVDLTAVPLRNFSHNRWILPRNHRRLGIANQPAPTNLRR
ncbi:HTTM domain-containing protein [Bremerella sp. JC770]|uniref:HTTM domain-containing protein n=1 Tax=Bremerella sp. JC770 TaxID=3232137 RepID=UPI003457B48F